MSTRIASQIAILGGNITYLSIHLKNKREKKKSIRSSSLNNVRSQAAILCLYYCEISGVTVIINVLISQLVSFSTYI